jgi:hypothetical protein
MDDQLKHKLYDAFLKDTPIKFEDVTDKQWRDMQGTLVGFSITLSSAINDVAKALGDIFKGLGNGKK